MEEKKKFGKKQIGITVGVIAVIIAIVCAVVALQPSEKHKRYDELGKDMVASYQANDEVMKVIFDNWKDKDKPAPESIKKDKKYVEAKKKVDSATQNINTKMDKDEYKLEKMDKKELEKLAPNYIGLSSPTISMYYLPDMAFANGSTYKSIKADYDGITKNFDKGKTDWAKFLKTIK